MIYDNTIEINMTKDKISIKDKVITTALKEVL